MSESPSSSIPENLQGSVERVTFHSPDTGYAVIRLRCKGHRDLVTLIGHVPSIQPGEFVEAAGVWIQHREYGAQFKANYLKAVHPSSLEGIEKYLGSGMIKGIGPHFAQKLVKEFGIDVFEVIEKSPESLRRVAGIGAARLKKITGAWEEQKIVRDIMVFLQSHGVSTARSVRIYKTYGQEAIARVSANPYQLARDVHGIGFKSADKIAGNLGVAKDSIQRARAGLSYALLEQIGAGHCAFPRDILLEQASQLLEIDPSILERALQLELQDGHLITDNIAERPCIYSAGLFRTERVVAEMFYRLANGSVPWGVIDASKAIDWAENQLVISLAPLQREAIEKALSSKVLILTGGPGTGKTTLTKALLAILGAKRVSIALCSPTGRAAKRLSECTGLEAKTIHRMLGFDPKKKSGFQHDRANPLDADLVLVDEASMVDVNLMQSLLAAVPKRSALILVGDVDQIPSVGPGCVLQSLIEARRLTIVRLTQIFRQAAESAIIVNAHQINRGTLPDLRPQPKQSDFHFLESDLPETMLARIVDLVKTRIPRHLGIDPIRDIQVLCPMNRGAVGARTLNIELQKVLNPEPVAHIERFGNRYSAGDKVMVTQNDYDKEVFNGDIGFVREIDLEEQEVAIDFDGRDVFFSFSELDIVALAYATTIHKAQGSEYPAVVIPIAMQHYMMLKRNLLYTGVTRGKRLVVLVGQKKAIAMAVRSENQGRRWNNLALRLREAFDGAPRPYVDEATPFD